MTIITTQSAAGARVGTVSGFGARLIGALAMIATTTLVATTLASQPANAQQQRKTVCGERDKILARLEQKHQEKPQALGLSADGGVLEVLVSPEGGWTILVTYPERPTCIVAVGQAWQSLTHLVGQPA